MLETFTNLNHTLPTELSFNFKNRDFESLELVESRIFKFLEEDKQLEQPVILSITPKAVSKLNYFLAGLSERPVAVGIAGETASGKSSFVYDLVDAVNSIHYIRGMEEQITKINADNYYYDRSNEVAEAGGIAKFMENYDFDHPSSVDLDLLKVNIQTLISGRDAYTPKYLMDGTAVRFDNYFHCKAKPIIVTEGIFNLNDRIKDVFDLRMFVQVSPQAQRERWFRRAAERDFKGEQAEKAFASIMEKTQIHIKPSIKYADIVINGEAKREDYRKAAEKLFNIYMDCVKVPV
jgi:uridine kinase